MEESACLSADELHFGYQDISPKNIGFILSNWYIQLDRAILLGEKLTIHTWPIKPQRLIVLRDFEFFVGDEKVGVATSRWCLVDLKTFSLLPTSSVFANDTREYNDFRSVEFNNWKIAQVEPMAFVYGKTVVLSDYDHYNHVNNTKYADFVLDAFVKDELKGKRMVSAQMSYLKQCKWGEKIDFYRAEDNGFTYIEGRCGEELRVAFKVKMADV
jgi:acyl-ACP thioesterase